MAGIYQRELPTAPVFTPSRQYQNVDFGVNSMLKAGSILGEALGSVKDKELADNRLKMQQDEILENKRRWDIANARADAQEARSLDEYNRGVAKEVNTNEALRAVLNPTEYTGSKIAEEQQSIQNSLANLSPQDRAIAEQQLKANYSPEASGKDWLSYATNATGIDRGRILDVKNKDYEVKAKTPGTPEYIAAEQARMNLFKQEQAISHANRLSEIGAQNAGQMGYLRAQQDAPREMVDPTSGKAYFVKPSEMANYPSNLIAKDTLSSFLTNTREQAKIEQDKRKYEQEKILKGKEALAGTVAVLGNQDSTLATIGDMSKLAQDMGVTLTDADLSNSIKATTNGSSWTDRGKPDVDTSLLRDRLMQVISAQSKKPLDEILKKYESKGVTPTTKSPETPYDNAYLKDYISNPYRSLN